MLKKRLQVNKTTRLQVFFKDAKTQRRKDAELLIVME